MKPFRSRCVDLLVTAMLRTPASRSSWAPKSADVPSPVPEGIITARLRRAQANLFETLPLFAIAIFIAHAGGRKES